MYNPLSSGLVALVQRISSIPLPILYARIGPYLNLAGPILLWVLVSLYFDRWTGLAGLSAYLFLNDHGRPSWFTATYSPWLWPCNFCQGLFLGTVILYIWARKTNIWSRNLITGVALGLTFLGHSAPALILALAFTVFTLGKVWRYPSRWRSEIGQLLTIGLASFLVSLPFLGPLLLVYQGKVQNQVPANFAPLGIPELLASYANIRGIIAAVGLFFLGWSCFRQRKQKSSKKREEWVFLLTLMGVVLLLLVYAAIAQTLGFRRLVPLFHFQIYTKLMETILFGIGLVCMGNLLQLLLVNPSRFRKRIWVLPLKLRSFSRPAQRISPSQTQTQELKHRRSQFHSVLNFTALLLIITAFYIPSYLIRVDNVGYREGALEYAQEKKRIALYQWARENSHRDQVFLADPRMSLYALVAAGRKVVCLHPVFSNPFVDYQERYQDNLGAFDLLRKGNFVEFSHLVDKYQISFLVIRENAGENYHMSRKEIENLEQRFSLCYHSDDIWVFCVSRSEKNSQTGLN